MTILISPSRRSRPASRQPRDARRPACGDPPALRAAQGAGAADGRDAPPRQIRGRAAARHRRAPGGRARLAARGDERRGPGVSHPRRRWARRPPVPVGGLRRFNAGGMRGLARGARRACYARRRETKSYVDDAFPRHRPGRRRPGRRRGARPGAVACKSRAGAGLRRPRQPRGSATWSIPGPRPRASRPSRPPRRAQRRRPPEDICAALFSDTGIRGWAPARRWWPSSPITAVPAGKWAGC